MRKLATVDRVLTVLQTRTQKQAAKFLNVSERTIRRWKNEGVEPTAPHREILVERSSRERTRLRRQAAREGFVLPDTRVQLPGRRQTRLDPRDPKRQRRIPSDTVIYKVDKSRMADMLALMQSYRDQGGAFRVVHELPAGKTDYTKQKYGKKRNVSTTWESIAQSRFQSDDGVLDFLQDLKQIGKLLYIVFTLPKKRKPRKKK